MNSISNLKLYLPYKILTLEGVCHGLYVLWLTGAKGLSPALTAGLLAAGDLLLTFLQIPTGRLADRVGRRVCLMLGSLIQAIGILVLWWGEGWMTLGLGCLLVGLADSLRDGADEAILYESLADAGRVEEFGRWVARVKFFSQFALAGLLLLGGFVATYWSFEAAWALEFLLSMAGFVVAFLFVEPPRTDDDAEEAGLRESHPPFSLVFPTSAILVLACSTSFGVEATWSVTPLVLTFVVALTMLGEAAGAAWSFRKPSTMALILLCAGTAASALWLEEWLLLALSVMTSAVYGKSDAERAVGIQSWAPPKSRATAASIAYFWDLLWQSVGLVIFGWVLANHGIDEALVAMAVLSSLAIILSSRRGECTPSPHLRR